MSAHKFLAFIQASKLNSINQLIRPIEPDDRVAKNCKHSLVQSYESPPQTSRNRRFLVKLLDRLYQSLLHSVEISQESKINWMCDRKGRPYLKIYDPYTQKHHYFESEQYARDWLERSR